ncbi:MAG: hypothetical protein GXX83_07230 [Gaiellales bacterium]|nr:hypothetical protein [Gaiellales bacterium]
MKDVAGQGIEARLRFRRHVPPYVANDRLTMFHLSCGEQRLDGYVLDRHTHVHEVVQGGAMRATLNVDGESLQRAAALTGTAAKATLVSVAA